MQVVLERTGYWLGSDLIWNNFPLKMPICLAFLPFPTDLSLYRGRPLKCSEEICSYFSTPWHPPHVVVWGEGVPVSVVCVLNSIAQWTVRFYLAPYCVPSTQKRARPPYDLTLHPVCTWLGRSRTSRFYGWPIWVWWKVPCRLLDQYLWRIMIITAGTYQLHTLCHAAESAWELLVSYPLYGGEN